MLLLKKCLLAHQKSDFHKKNINRLVQLVGRATGHKNYVNKMNIITTKEIYNKVNDMTDKFVDLRRNNIENYNISDFSNKNSAIPVKLEFVDNDFRLNLLEICKQKLNKQYKNTKISCNVK